MNNKSSSHSGLSLHEAFEKAHIDQYRAVRVNIESSDSSSIVNIEEFEKVLQQALIGWQSRSSKKVDFQSRVRSAHLKIDAKFSELIPICLKKFGFEFHHCTPEYIFLHRWIATEEKNTYPPFCQHYIGTGGCVVDFKTEEILLITEKINIRTDLPKHVKPFKIPGGQLEKHEFIEEGCVREVWEETSVETNFRGILGFRYKKDFRFGVPDIYYICLLEPKSQEHKDAIAACPNEIDLCQWTPLEEYYKLDGLSKVQQHVRSLIKRYHEMRKTNPSECDKLLFKSTVQSSEHFDNSDPELLELLYPNIN
ncbi:predicted protein [Naegleria gruberi]|uniref:Predicted protein n=1 Tax=Naegleria gruberi TaxID=5762 RepID=D2VF03_NAEGR|nr:uncharacterized protein NAEGRDRAFT_33480 [Naegleria gruberi]EFC44691.1 predicted protein [Naegleria gruberi]|eukprot:XP_002677435.1 predicted protein [Naegleria gruberi strain NEG-M]